MKNYRKIIAAAVVFIATAGQAQNATRITITPSVTYQTIDNFAASDCWNAEYVGRYFSTTNREKVAKWLFSTRMDANGNPTGIGLSSWRVNLGAGSATQGDNSGIEDVTRRVDCFLQADGTYDWSRCPGQQYFMKAAKDYGVNDFVLFSNSAPIHYTKNGFAHSDRTTGSANLKDDCYDDFAEFLATCAQHFTDQGYNITHISPVNEPSFDWLDGQEGCHWTNATIAKLSRELDKSITSRNLSTKQLIPEAVSYSQLSGLFTQQHISQLFGSTSSNYVGNLPSMAPIIAAHSYWTFGTNSQLKSTRTTARDQAAKYGLKVYQTEWSLLDNAPNKDTGFPEGGYDAATRTDIALFMAKVIQCDLIYANAASWSYWTAMAQEQWGQKDRFFLIRINATGDTGYESYGSLENGGSVYDDMTLWALGNFSLFIRPGYQRIGMSGAEEMNGLLGSSYLSPDGKKLVCVIVNTGSDERTIDLGIDGGDFKGYTINKYITDSRHRLRRELTLPTDYDGAPIGITARSITTITLEKPEESLPGDINLDNTIDIADLNCIVDVVLGNKPSSAYNNRTDLNKDNKTDVSDLNYLISIILS